MARRLLWGSLVLAPVAIAARFVFHAGDVALFVLAAAALVPLAWLIGESTEHAAEHTGAGVGGFLNASFGNAPELIIALFAVNAGLPNVVRGSLAGSVVSNILLVLGIAMIVGGEGELDRRSLFLQLGLVATAVLAFLVPSIPGWHGNPDRHSLAVLTIPVMSTLVPGAWLRTPGMTTYRLVLPCLAIWLVIQRSLLQPPPRPVQIPVASDELGVELELDVPLQRG